MSFIFRGLTFFSGKAKNEKELRQEEAKNPYVKASEDLKRSAEELKKATRKLQESFRTRQEAMNKLVWIFNNLSDNRSRSRSVAGKVSKPSQKARQYCKEKARKKVSETELFEIYREACVNFVETDKEYYFKLRNHSVFLCSMYKRYMGNLRYYDHEFLKLTNQKQYRFSDVEAYVANEVLLTVNRIGREKFIRDGHQALYNELCSKLLPQSVNQ